MPESNVTKHLELNRAYSIDCRNSFTSPVRQLHCEFLGLGLQLRRQSHQLLPGYLLCGIAYSPLHVRPDDVPYTSTLGRHYSADARGAQHNGSSLRI
jgi:hypothetical protein